MKNGFFDCNLNTLNTDLYNHVLEALAKDYSDFVRNLAGRIKNWTYGGNIEILLFQGHESDNSCFDFRNYISINITYGIKSGYISSFSSFMESMINHVEDAISAGAIAVSGTNFNIFNSMCNERTK